MLHETSTFLLLLAVLTGVWAAHHGHSNESAPHSPPCPSVDTALDLTPLTTDSPVPVSRRSVGASELFRAHISSSAAARTSIVSRLISAALRRVFRHPDTLSSRIKRQALSHSNVFKKLAPPPVRGIIKIDPKPIGPIEDSTRQPRKQQSRQTPHYELMDELEDRESTTMTISSRKASRIPLTETTSTEAEVIESSYLQSQQEQESWQQDDVGSSGSRCTNQLFTCLLIATQTAILAS